MVTDRITACVVLGVAHVGCGGGSGADGADANASHLMPPEECAIGPVDPDWVYPAGPYGIDVGDRMENLVLNDCDREPVDVGHILSQADHLLVNIGAGWCEPCVEETETLDAEVFRAFCGRGLRVVQILFEENRSLPATSLFCSEWRQRFGLSFPVLYDPLFVTQRYFESVQAQTPINYIIDSTGEIVFKHTGTVPGDLADQLDALLPE